MFIVRFLLPRFWGLLKRIDSDFSSFAASSWESESIDALIGLCAGSFATPPPERPWRLLIEGNDNIRAVEQSPVGLRGRDV